MVKEKKDMKHYLKSINFVIIMFFFTIITILTFGLALILYGFIKQEKQEKKNYEDKKRFLKEWIKENRDLEVEYYQ